MRRCSRLPRGGVLLALAAAAAALAPCAANADAGASAPLLRVATPIAALPANESELSLGMELTAPSRQQVSVSLALLARAGDGEGWLVAGDNAGWLEPSELSWAAGESGVQWVQLTCAPELLQQHQQQQQQQSKGMGARMAQPRTATGTAAANGGVGAAAAALLVRLEGAKGAEVASAAGEARILLAPSAGDEGDATLPVFGFVPNQVAYCPESTRSSSGADSSGSADMVVRLLHGTLATPATVRYQATLLTPEAQQFVPARAMQGYLYFVPGEDAQGAAPTGAQQQLEQRVRLPVDWARVPPEAEYRLGLELEGFYHARVAAQGGDVALHIFGTPNGTCPPGAAVVGGRRNSSASVGHEPPQQPEQHALTTGQPVGMSDLSLSFNGDAIDLSSSFRPDVHDYGAMANSSASNVTLCLKSISGTTRISVVRVAADSILGDSGSVSPQADAGSPTATSSAVAPVPAADVASHCSCAADDAGGSCSYRAWVLPLEPGQNQFNVTVARSGSISIKGSSSEQQQQQQQYRLAVVRLVPPDHAMLASLSAKSISASGRDGATTTLCAHAAAAAPAAAPTLAAAALSSTASRAGEVTTPPPCQPGVLLTLNVSDATDLVALTPHLLRADLLGARVEVNGQVLSRGGDAAADQREDTTAAAAAQRVGAASFLPSAFIMGMRPGEAVDVQVVVVADDGVTSARYPLRITRLPSSAAAALAPGGWAPAAAVSEASMSGSSRGEGGTSWGVEPLADLVKKGWPTPPARQPGCTTCPAGWASAVVNSSECTMCPPGTAAPRPQSTACAPCAPGTYAYSWGSTHCKHCIAGTFASAVSSALCRMCPSNTTSGVDGAAACERLAGGGTDLSRRYAVLVSFSIFLSGLDPDVAVLRAGVNAPASAIVENLVRADTAAAFNISMEDVQVRSVSQVARRTLQANVTATLGVDVSPGATDEEIATALEVQRLSADEPIAMLSQDPERFFGRTTKTLDVSVQSSEAATLESRPGDSGPAISKWALVAPGIVTLVGGAVLVALACRRSRRCAQWRGAAGQWLATSRLAPRAVRYTRYAAT